MDDKVIFSKEYDGESIIDLTRDISEAFDQDFTPVLGEIPDMEGSPGFWSGTFKVHVTWSPEKSE